MLYHAQKDRYIGAGQAFEVDGLKYPANWLDHASQADVEALGLVPVEVVGARLDDRYYDHTETLSGAVLTIVATPKDTATLRAIKWREIQSERDRRLTQGGYQVDGHWFHSDPYSLVQQQGLTLAARQIEAASGDMDAPMIDVPWKTMTGETVPMTPHMALALLPAAMEQQVAIFAAAEAHRANMESSLIPADYDCINGWPVSYGDVIIG